MFWSKVFTTKEEIVVAICDEELLDKKVEFKGHMVRITKKFYGGERIDEKEAVELMEKATIGNLFGKRIIKLAEKHGFIGKENVIRVGGIPHAQFAKM